MASFYIKLGAGQLSNGPSGGLTDSQLRASPVPVSVSSIALPAGASTSALQNDQITELQNLEAELQAANISLVAIDSNTDGIEASLAGVSTLAEQLVQSNALDNIENNTSLVTDAIVRTIAQIGPGNGAAGRNVLVGGVYKEVPTTLTNGDQSEIILNSKGQIIVEVANPLSEVGLDSSTIDQIKPLDVQPAVLPTVTETDGPAVGPGLNAPFIKVGGWDIDQAEYRQLMFRGEDLRVSDSRLPSNLGLQDATGSLPVVSANGVLVSQTGVVAPAINMSLLFGNVTTTGWYDAAGFNSGSFTINSSISSGTFAIEQTNDSSSTVGVNIPFQNSSNIALSATVGTGAVSTTAATYNFPIQSRYFRIRMATAATGTVNARTFLKQVPYATNSVFMAGGTANVTVASGAITASTAVPGIITDVVSAAIATTTTTATLTPTTGNTYQVAIPVTVVSGTNPTMDVQIQESADSGVNWYAVYDFPRITTTGISISPVIRLTGARVRYVQTISGTTPSFTRSIQRSQSNSNAQNSTVQLINRTIDLNLLGSVSAAISTRNSRSLQLVLSVGAIATTAPQVILEGSDDGGLTYYAISSPLTGVASSTVQLTVTNTNSAFVRARVVVAGSGVTPNYVLIKGF